MIDYNLLNLPKKVVKATSSLEYVYDALGNRLAKKLNGNFTQLYAGSLVYNGDKTVAYAIHLEGLAPKVGTGFTYQYNITDHLGNVRAVLDPSKTVVQKTDYYPFGLTHAVSNLNKNKYLFGGKEIQDELSLNTYDFHARQQDPITGRFTSIDPMADEYNDISGYVYTINNPINIIDPDGMDTIDVKNLDWSIFDPDNDIVKLEPATIIEFRRTKIDYDREDSWLYEAMPNNLAKNAYQFLFGDPYQPMIIGIPPMSGTLFSEACYRLYLEQQLHTRLLQIKK